MTDVETIPAGRELDALIASRVFDVDVSAPPPVDNFGSYSYPGWGRWLGVPPFSTDIAAAWKVVAKLKDFALFSPGQSAEGGIFADDVLWTVYCDMPAHELGWSCGETVPLAICRAALASVSRTVG